MSRGVGSERNFLSRFGRILIQRLVGKFSRSGAYQERGAFTIFIACDTDETKLWLSPSANQRQNLGSGPPSLHQDLSTRAKIDLLKNK